MEALMRVYLLADIEGSSGCFGADGARYRTPAWAKACVELSRDVDTAVKACFAAGVSRVTVRDFHRTCYNLLPELIDPRARIVQGYRLGEITGMGDVSQHDVSLFLGMHASSGSGGFLAHTLTSRIVEATVNGRPLAEIELFAGVLAARSIRPAFFSGGPCACAEARALIADLGTHAIDKGAGPAGFEAAIWRTGLGEAIQNRLLKPVETWTPPPGPYQVRLRLRDGETSARSLATQWGLEACGDTLHFVARDHDACYLGLLRICYLTPRTERLTSYALPLLNLLGRRGLRWARKKAFGVRRPRGTEGTTTPIGDRQD
jgi:D-aminopeptidase